MSTTKVKILKGRKIQKRNFPNQVLTREQMAQMLYRAYFYKTSPKPEITVTLAFDDASEINTGAIDEVKGVIALNLMKGISEKIFSPISLSTREQAFVVIYRFINKLGMIEYNN